MNLYFDLNSHMVVQRFKDYSLNSAGVLKFHSFRMSNELAVSLVLSHIWQWKNIVQAKQE